MANNRMHIYCTTCLELQVIAKYYPAEWYVHTEDLASRLTEFLDKHNKTCHKGFDGEGMFGLRTENDDDGFITDYSGQQFKVIRKGITNGAEQKEG